MAAVYNEPWLITESHLLVICEVLERAITRENLLDRPQPEFRPRPMPDKIGDMSVIPITGIISRRINMMDRISGGTSIEQLDLWLDEALNDVQTTTIFLHVDSPGGGVAGVAEFAQRVKEASSVKETIALADGTMGSAAYYIGSQADRVYATKASGVGSIGVVARILDASRMAENAGIKETVIRSSELKAAGLGPLTAAQLSHMQERVNQIAEMFRADVSSARPDIDFSSGVDFGQMFIGQHAVDNGLIDGVMSIEQLIEKFA